MSKIEEWIHLANNALKEADIELSDEYVNKIPDIKQKMISPQNRKDYQNWYPIKHISLRGIINYTYYVNINKKSKDFKKFLCEIEIDGSYKYGYASKKEIQFRQPTEDGYILSNRRQEMNLKAKL